MMLKFWKDVTGKSKTDLSQALDCFCRDATLHAYGLKISSFNLLPDYLSNHKQRIKLDSIFSS